MNHKTKDAVIAEILQQVKRPSMGLRRMKKALYLLVLAVTWYPGCHVPFRTPHGAYRDGGAALCGNVSAVSFVSASDRRGF